jgi:ribosomal protein S18 acetylase RimI-like enzyme
MKTTQRGYSEEAGDFNRLCRVVVDHNDQVRARSMWCLGRLVDWKYGLYENKTSVVAFWEQNARLWFDGFGELAGFIISENGGPDFAIITLDGYRFLFEEMLEWVLENWGDREGKLTTELTEHQAPEAAILEDHGLRLKATFFTEGFDLTQELPPSVPLEAGFSIVDMGINPDYRAQRILRADAFSGKSALTEGELRHQMAFYNHIHDGPIYHPETDLCVMAEDGTFVAGCEALIDARNRAADIERVCTHSRFRRRGFARAVIRECMVRLRDMGMRDAYITGYSPEAIGLYRSLGSASELRALVYEMDG